MSDSLPSLISPKRILVVDDADAVAETIQATLVQLGHKADIANDSKEVLRRFEAGKYDLIITDYSMPKMNGLQLAAAIKKQSPSQLIVLVTAYTFSIAANDTRQLPVDFLLRKPFTPRELNESLAELFTAAAKATA